MLIIGVDPGLTTGVAAVKFGPGQMGTLFYGQIPESPGANVLLKKLNVCMQLAQGATACPQILAVEDFILPHRVHGPKEAKETLKIIGAVESFAAMMDYRLVYITPPETKAFPMKRVCEVTRKTPKEARKWPHAADAVRVALAAWSKEQRGGR